MHSVEALIRHRVAQVSQEGDDVRISRAKLDALRLLAKDALEAGE